MPPTDPPPPLDQRGLGAAIQIVAGALDKAGVATVSDGVAVLTCTLGYILGQVENCASRQRMAKLAMKDLRAMVEASAAEFAASKADRH